MARDRLVPGAGEGGLDPVRRRRGPLVGGGDVGTPVGDPRREILDHPKARELGRDRLPAGVQGPQRRGDFRHRLRLAQLLRRHRLAGHEPGHQAGWVVEHRHHPRADPRPRRQLARRPLGGAVDSQQLGVLARQANHQVLAGEADLVVAIAPRVSSRDAIEVGRRFCTCPLTGVKHGFRLAASV